LTTVARVLFRLDQNIVFQPQPELASYVNWGGSATAPIHRWLRYREAYSPHLITKLSLGEKILDPFCGCGSIMVGAAEAGRMSVGIDLNPLAVFATRVKLSPLNSHQLAAVNKFARLLDGLDSYHMWQPHQLPALAIADKVFEPEILDTLMRLRTGIAAAAGSDLRVHDFLLLAWIAILQKVGSYFKEGNGIKYRNKKRMKGKYARRPDGEWQRQRFGPNQPHFVLRAFADQLNAMLTDTSHWGEGTWGRQQVIEGDALQMDSLIGPMRFDSIVFSPPYANRFDYFESLKVELWFGGFVDSYAKLRDLRKTSIRSHLGADLSRACIRLDPLEELISFMDRSSSSWRMGVADLLRGYFDDMFHILRHCREALGSGACLVIVGNSAFAGVIIPTDALIAHLGTKAGFKNVRILEVRHLTVAPQQRTRLNGLETYMRESVVVLQ
jgi:hypothetical protein